MFPAPCTLRGGTKNESVLLSAPVLLEGGCAVLGEISDSEAADQRIACSLRGGSKKGTTVHATVDSGDGEWRVDASISAYSNYNPSSKLLGWNGGRTDASSTRFLIHGTSRCADVPAHGEVSAGSPRRNPPGSRVLQRRVEEHEESDANEEGRLSIAIAHRSAVSKGDFAHGRS